MRVALINTNTYLYPPTIPVGMEYLIEPLKRAGHEIGVLDLAFSDRPVTDAVSFLEDFKPNVACFSVRNTDTCLFLNRDFLLLVPAEIIKVVKENFGIPLVVGGAATMASAGELRVFLGADFVVSGPGEVSLPFILRALEEEVDLPDVIDGWEFGISPGLVHSRGELIDYEPYLKENSPVGVETKKGCDWPCPFCLERNRPILEREIEPVIGEIKELASKGVRTVFICDSEVNIGLDVTLSLLRSIAKESTGTEFTGYFRPSPQSPEMFKLLALANFRKVTLSVNSFDLSCDTPPYTGSDVVGFTELAHGHGISVAVDLLVGYPGESSDSVKRALHTVEKARPETAGVNPYIRLYQGTPALAHALESSKEGMGQIFGRIEGNPGLLEPVFYSSVDISWLEGEIRGSDIFVLEGTSKTVNYQRI